MQADLLTTILLRVLLSHTTLGETQQEILCELQSQKNPLWPYEKQNQPWGVSPAEH